MEKEINEPQLNRCRLIITANSNEITAQALIEAVSSGDVASVVLYARDSEAHEFETYCKDATPKLQALGCAVLIADDTQAFGRSGADGLFVEKEKSKLEDMIARFSPQNIVGCGNIKARHNALEIGEAKPDFVFFGKLGGDIKPEAHPKNIALADWWAELVEIPGIVMGGNHLDSIIEVAKTGVDFIALEQAIFSDGNAADNIVKANKILDEHAPSFDEDGE